jgi:hypothetical protein
VEKLRGIKMKTIYKIMPMILISLLICSSLASAVYTYTGVTITMNSNSTPSGLIITDDSQIVYLNATIKGTNNYGVNQGLVALNLYVYNIINLGNATELSNNIQGINVNEIPDSYWGNYSNNNGEVSYTINFTSEFIATHPGEQFDLVIGGVNLPPTFNTFEYSGNRLITITGTSNGSNYNNPNLPIIFNLPPLVMYILFFLAFMLPAILILSFTYMGIRIAYFVTILDITIFMIIGVLPIYVWGLMLLSSVEIIFIGDD